MTGLRRRVERTVRAADDAVLAVVVHEEDGVDVTTTVFLHALGCRADMWDPVIAELGSAAGAAVALELRGHGRSEAGAGPMDLSVLVGDVRSIIDGVGASACHLVGCSLGGLMAQAAALELGDRVASLTLINTGGVIATPDSWAARIAAVEENGLPPLADAFAERLFSPSFRSSSPEVVGDVVRTVVATPAAGYISACGVLAATDLRHRLASVSVPTLVIAGSADVATPVDAAEAIVQRVPGSELVVLPGVGHLAPIEAPRSVAAAIARHIEAAA
ncbi:MAG: alpha/beta fold hydrolase [Actinomycetota bacterium]